VYAIGEIVANFSFCNKVGVLELVEMLFDWRFDEEIP